MKRDYLVYIEDMLDAMEKAELNVEGVTYDETDIPQVKPLLHQILAGYGEA